MWKTPQRDRALRGYEASLFQRALSSLVGWLEGDEGGVKVFDTLSKPEKLAVLEIVVSCLLEEGVPAPAHTAVNEGAIAAVYAQVMVDVDLEIDSDEASTEVRDLVTKAAAACDLSDSTPALTSRKHWNWKDLIEEILDCILRDRDWMEEFVKPDDSPERAAEIRDFARIDPDY